MYLKASNKKESFEVIKLADHLDRLTASFVSAIDIASTSSKRRNDQQQQNTSRIGD